MTGPLRSKEWYRRIRRELRADPRLFEWKPDALAKLYDVSDWTVKRVKRQETILHMTQTRLHIRQMYTEADWEPIVKLMGKVSDAALAKQSPMTAGTISKKRRELGIMKCPRIKTSKRHLRKIETAATLPHNDVDRYLYAMFKPLAARYGR